MPPPLASFKAVSAGLGGPPTAVHADGLNTRDLPPTSGPTAMRVGDRCRPAWVEYAFHVLCGFARTNLLLLHCAIDFASTQRTIGDACVSWVKTTLEEPMHATQLPAALALILAFTMLFGAGCTSSQPPAAGASGEPASVPPEVKAWMDRLTVSHEYDPATGFIVARETISLPPIIADAPPLDVAIAKAGPQRLVVAFATADRCAPCQQYKRDALNNSAVITRLSDARFLPTHVEVDRSPELAETYLGTRSIPMTYALRDGKVIATLRGQRTATDLLAWLDALPQ
jgi:hypothetical protein